MDLVRLGTVSGSPWIPDLLIDEYTSLIWTERFQEPGQFELKSGDVRGLMSSLPEGALVSHLDTQVVMVVENRSIGRDAKGYDELTVTGRTLETVLEQRYIEAEYQKKRRMRQKYTGTAAACVLIYNSIDNSSGKDLTRGDVEYGTPAWDEEKDGPEQNDYDWNTKDKIPNVAVTETVSVEGSKRWWQVEAGAAYPQIMKILEAQDLGLRVVRPVNGSAANLVTVQWGLQNRGNVVRTYTTNIQSMRFDVYQGVDHSSDVKFSLLQGHLKDPRYLFSNSNYRTGVYMRGGVGIGDVYRSTADSNLTGLDRRMMDYDAGTPEIPPEPEKPEELRKNATKEQKEARAEAMDKWLDKHAKWKNKRARILSDFRDEAKEDALRLLKTRRRVSMFSGDISELAPYQYRTHYNLGDTVMLYGDYGQEEAMVVSEYVRTRDTNGDRGFPGLITP